MRYDGCYIEVVEVLDSAYLCRGKHLFESLDALDTESGRKQNEVADVPDNEYIILLLPSQCFDRPR